MDKYKYQVGLVAIIAIASLSVFVKTIRSGIVPDNNKAPKTKYSLTMLTQSAGVDGKLIVATFKGHSLGTYRCTRQDAAVAWFLLQDELGRNKSSMLSASIVDGQNIAMEGTGEGHEQAFLVRIFKGYAIKPSKVIVKLTAMASAEQETKFEAKMDQIADAERVIPELTSHQKSIANQYAIAEIFDHNTTANVHTVKPDRPGEFTHAVTLHTSHSLGPIWSPSYWNNVDAIEARVDTFRQVESEVVLRYRNAQVATVNGLRVLRFPSNQSVGSFDHLSISISKYMPMPKRGSKTRISRGDVLLFLQPEGDLSRHEITRSLLEIPIVKLEGIFPSVDQMGLDFVRVRLSGTRLNSGFDQTFTASHRSSRLASDAIPELRFRTKITHAVLVSSRTCILPLKHRKSPPLKVAYSPPTRK